MHPDSSRRPRCDLPLHTDSLSTILWANVFLVQALFIAAYLASLLTESLPA